MNDTAKTHTIVIHNDMKCEDDAVEQFFSSISLVDPGLLNIIVDPNQATVTIDDSSEPECGTYEILLADSKSSYIQNLLCRTN